MDNLNLSSQMIDLFRQRLGPQMHRSIRKVVDQRQNAIAVGGKSPAMKRADSMFVDMKIGVKTRSKYAIGGVFSNVVSFVISVICGK